MATLRTYGDDMLKKVKERAKNMASSIAQTYNLEIETDWVEPFPATVNNEDAVQMVRLVAEDEDFEMVNKEAPFGWSEDFGHFTDAYKGALFGLGSGIDQPALHAANYNFPDEIIETGVKMFTGIIDQIIE
jgi:metal-dependent amidase/aminoacylase/carboxypeptidase family protein